MVSNASDDFPEPLTPVNTTNLSLGIFKLMFLNYALFAPRITISFLDIILLPF